MNRIVTLTLMIGCICLTTVQDGFIYGMNIISKKISVDFTDVYADEQVILIVRNKVEFNGKITTDWTNGVAKHLTFGSESLKENAVIEVPRLHIKKRVILDLQKGLYLAIALHENNLVISQTMNQIPRD